MLFTVLLSDIQKQLFEIAGIAGNSPKNKEDITQNVYIEATNNQLICRATDYYLELESVFPLSDLQTEGAITVDAVKVREALKSLDASTLVTFETDDEREILKIRSNDKSSYEIRTRAASAFPPFTHSKDYESIVLQQKQLKAIIDGSKLCIAQEDFRDYLRGLRLEASDNLLSAFSSDGHRMAIIEVQLMQPVKSNFGAILTKKCVEELSKILDAASDVPVTLKFTNNTVSVDVNGYTLSSKLIVSPYPNVRTVVPKVIETMVDVPAAQLIKKIQQVAIMSSKRVNGVSFNFTKGVVQLRAENNEHEIATAELPIEYNGNDLEVSLNASYVVDALSCIKSADARFKFSNPLVYLLLTPTEEYDEMGLKFLYVISKVVI